MWPRLAYVRCCKSATRWSQLRSARNCLKPAGETPPALSWVATLPQDSWARFTALAFVIRGFFRRWCEVLCTCSYQKQVESQRVGCWPQRPHWSAADSSLLDVSPELRRLEVVSRCHRDYRRGCSLWWGALVRENELLFERRPSVCFVGVWGYVSTMAYHHERPCHL